MGEDKSLLPLHGQPLIRAIYEQLQPQFDEILISTNEPEKHGFLGVKTVPDRVPGQGPLRGIASAVEAARHDLVFVVACDIPVIDLPTVRHMLALARGADCVIPTSGAGHEPLFAVYRKAALPAMLDVLATGERRISGIFPRVRMQGFDLRHAGWYRNLNTREDVAAFLAGR
jgi:molybdopterin-guanine dinucleotide biosynthesis protein A